MERTRRKRGKTESGAFWRRQGDNLLVARLFNASSARRINADPLTWDVNLANQLWSGEEVTLNLPLLRELVGSMGAANRAELAKIVEQANGS